jgi:hypothetical protein
MIKLMIDYLNTYKYIIMGCSILIFILIQYKEELKTRVRMNQDIDFTIPENYIKRQIEDDLFNVINNNDIAGVYVLCAPKNIGKTTAIKSVLKRIHNTNKIINFHNGDNNMKPHLFELKSVYIDVNTDMNFLKQNNDVKFISNIPDNKRVIVVLDHMSHDILDNINARHFYGFHAYNSYNTYPKYVIIVVTNDESYTNNILQNNGGRKVHRIKLSK